MPVAYVVLGATGHVGSAVADRLLHRGEAVTVVTRCPEKAAQWQRRGAQAAVADLGDPDALRAVLPRGARLFALNPPADPTTPDIDTDAEELRTAESIAVAIEGAGLDRVVAQSTYGAQPGERIGDLGTLHRFEQLLGQVDVPLAVSRGAYFFSNWDGTLPMVRDQGRLPTMFDPDEPVPMVAPADLGTAAADLLIRAEPHTGVQFVEGPRRYSPRDVAWIFGAALGREVEVVVTPRVRWVETFRGLGFSEKAAQSYAGMTVLSAGGEWELPGLPVRGTTTLEEYVTALLG